MKSLGDPSDLRGLLHLSGANLEDHDRELAKLVDEFEILSPEEKLKISDLVNRVVAFKVREKEEVQKRYRAEQYRDSIIDPKIKALRAHLDALGDGASSIPKGIRQGYKYPAILQETDWSTLKKGEDSLVHVKLAVLIPLGIWDDPHEAIARGDEFRLCRIRTIPSAFKRTEIKPSNEPPKTTETGSRGQESEGKKVDNGEGEGADAQVITTSDSEAISTLLRLVNMSLRGQAEGEASGSGQGSG